MSQATLNLDALRDHMEARGVDSVSELARLSQVERSLVSRILAGKRQATPSQILAFTRALGLRPLALLGPDDPAPAILAMAKGLAAVAS